ncbi:capsule biosynthesis protein [Methylobacterium sp. Leaf118]|uniref:capsule biosynthesis protein n=1 Tax=Methylobacterium sp. Leaf118 TaxID=2876562 RepID=UPI001E361B7B|nr:capsule biosynthesis protein [Methylobacterium sp. Leaf118]
MTTEISSPTGSGLTTGDRSTAVAESLKRFARIARQSDHRKGIRAYKTHVRRDPWVPALFVLLFVLPLTLVAGYLYLVASDRYVTEARFALRPALGNVDKVNSEKTGDDDSQTNPRQMIIQDTLITMNYIASRQMVETLERQRPVRDLFTRESIDYLSRAKPDVPIERFMRYWNHRIETKLDTTAGIITLTVAAFEPAESFDLAKAILAESERMVNELSIKARNAALTETIRELAVAEERMLKTRIAVRELRNRGGVLDAKATNTSNLTMLAALRKQRIDFSVQLGLGMRDLSADARPIRDLKAQIRDLDDNIEKIERQTASSDPNEQRILSDLMTQFEAYENQRKDAETYYAKVLSAHEAARILASRQVEFFTPVVEPIMPLSSTEPRRALWTSITAIVALLVFGLAVVIRKYSFQ